MRAVVFFWLLLALNSGSAHYSGGSNVVYHTLPHFWTGVGFCPAGRINHKDISETLASPAVQMNLRQISALPKGAVTHIRIHWLLELVEFLQYSAAGVPIYDFSKFDDFVDNLQELQLAPVLEFMANPGDVFLQNPNRNSFLWEHFAKTTVRHFLARHGAARMSNWRFETWNEPDIHNYNRLNFTAATYMEYVRAIRRGLSNATGHRRRRKKQNYRALRGPAGLFKSHEHHPLCWQLLDVCNRQLSQCPIDILTFHRKGHGEAAEILNGTMELLQEIYQQYPNLRKLPVANDEADPESNWSTPRDYQADVRYAVILLSTVLEHWRAKLAVNGVLSKLESLSHDNAFLSYHPHEFSQRTLLAHFRFNETQPPHSQFVQKPVYAALGMLSKLGNKAADVELVNMDQEHSVQVLRSVSGSGPSAYIAAIFVSPEQAGPQLTSYHHKYTLNMSIANESAFITELLVPQTTDPFYIWQQNGSPAYPNATLRAAMRRAQTPRLYETGPIWEYNSELVLNSASLPLPWAMLLRVCSGSWPKLKQPKNLEIVEVTKGEVFLSWRENSKSTQCLKTYEVWFRERIGAHWQYISKGWHLPYPSFQYAPAEGFSVNGFYKVRGVDLFSATSAYSEIVEYLEM
ncbi:alpha-L-iduronidase [Scaptodrosophila lebanonensis]|uniref:Alpha-L-iduronidase n=1 Tax=Drosophila lebanonensis TaxID=7225 RepID=A0A6J2U768_DROLE|nr:alpha-L-iduronidase [Scaptodrosophila lebanonensis]